MGKKEEVGARVIRNQRMEKSTILEPAVLRRQAVQAIAARTPIAAASVAAHSPRPLALTRTNDKSSHAANAIVMQAVPVDPMAGPIAKKSAKPRKLAAKPHQTPAQAVKSSIPALRLANDRQ